MKMDLLFLQELKLKFNKFFTQLLNPPFKGLKPGLTSGPVFPSKQQPIPIETKPNDEDSILLGWDDCPLFSRIKHKWLQDFQ